MIVTEAVPVWVALHLLDSEKLHQWKLITFPEGPTDSVSAIDFFW